MWEDQRLSAAITLLRQRCLGANAIRSHALLTTLLLGAIVLHIAGALFLHFIRRSDVLMRMFRLEGARNHS